MDAGNPVAARLQALQRRVREAERRFGRTPDSVRLLAVSKQQDVALMRAARRLGILDFGENHLQPAMEKMAIMSDRAVRWHFIGAIQSRKAKEVARRFDWAHGLDRLEIARRLHDARPEGMPKLAVCVQVRIGGESGKAGIESGQVASFLERLGGLDRLHVRGLMTIPAPVAGFDAQRTQFARLRDCQERMNAAGFELDVLSMGMSGDFEAAIAEGATWIRIGTALFGPRPQRAHA